MTTATELKTLDKSGALAMLEAAVKAKGRDYRYSEDFGENADCQYARHTPEVSEAMDKGDLPWDTTPPIAACVVGVGLAQAQGVSVEGLSGISDALPQLAGYHDTGAAWPSTKNIKALVTFIVTAKLAKEAESNELNLVGLDATEAAARVLWIAQLVQDNDATWGEALDAAHAVAQLIEGE